ncbi:DUF4055 domain-containing protein, partial [Xenorhabdus sp. SGI240]|uniref:DUF4055 domain-containing protein n=1 Tax=Xenorhabdus sp. SGI240 TaxID=3158262 RepID=UPI0032B7E98A
YPEFGLNIKHYQAEADIAESAHTVGQPMVALTGLDDAWIEAHMKDGFNYIQGQYDKNMTEMKK